MTSKFFLNFYGVKVAVHSEWTEIDERLRKDFSSFVVSEIERADLSLEINYQEPRLNGDDSRFTYKSSKVSFFENEHARTCSYQGKVESEIDFKSNHAIVYGQDLNAVHEVSYLLILSRVGKALDLRGLHRFHAAGWEYENTLYLALFSSGLGKSTILSLLMNENKVTLFSDDSPLVSTSGRVKPFPMRIGFVAEDPELVGMENVPFYNLKRFRFGEKRLYSLDDLNWKVGQNYQRVILLTGEKGGTPKIERSIGLPHAYQLFMEGVIGFGLPILYEYFWENGPMDFLKKAKIAIKRTIALSLLWIKARKYKVTIASDPNQTIQILKNFMDAN